MFIPCEEVRVLQLGPVQRDEGEQLAAISDWLMQQIDRFRTDDQGRTVRLWNGRHLVVDWSAFRVQVDDGLLRIPVRQAEYYWTLLGHSGTSTAIRDALDRSIRERPGLPFASLTDFAEALLGVNEGREFENRRSPLGVSLALMSRNAQRLPAGVLFGRRSSDLAVNPNVWTFPVDENVETVDPFACLTDGCSTELGLKSDHPIIKSAHLAGVHIPDSPGEPGCPTGVTVIYEAEVSQEQLLELRSLMLTTSMEMTREEAETHAGHPTDFVRRGLAEEEVSQPLLAWLAHRGGCA